MVFVILLLDFVLVSIYLSRETYASLKMVQQRQFDRNIGNIIHICNQIYHNGKSDNGSGTHGDQALPTVLSRPSSHPVHTSIN